MKYWIGIVLVAALSFSACNNEPGNNDERQAEMVEKMMEEGKGSQIELPTQDEQSPSELGNSSWTVTQLNYDGDDFPLENEKPQMLSFTGQYFSVGACPPFGGSFDIPADGQFALKEVNSVNTGKCDPSEAALGRRLREVLESATAYELMQEGQQLKLTGDKGLVLCSAN